MVNFPHQKFEIKFTKISFYCVQKWSEEDLPWYFAESRNIELKNRGHKLYLINFKFLGELITLDPALNIFCE